MTYSQIQPGYTGIFVAAYGGSTGLNLHFSPFLLAGAESDDFFRTGDHLNRLRVCRREDFSLSFECILIFLQLFAGGFDVLQRSRVESVTFGGPGNVTFSS